MKNYIEIIYVDDNGLDHHVRSGNVKPYKGACTEQTEMVFKLASALSVKLRDYLRNRGKPIPLYNPQTNPAPHSGAE